MTARRDPPKLADYIAALSPGDKLGGYVCRCEQCAALFVARRDARFCGNACRLQASRAK